MSWRTHRNSISLHDWYCYRNGILTNFPATYQYFLWAPKINRPLFHIENSTSVPQSICLLPYIIETLILLGTASQQGDSLRCLVTTQGWIDLDIPHIVKNSVCLTVQQMFPVLTAWGNSLACGMHRMWSSDKFSEWMAPWGNAVKMNNCSCSLPPMCRQKP